MRVLVAFEDEYRAYADALVSFIRARRPHLDVATVGLEALQAQVGRFDPHLVICSLPKPDTGENSRLSWVELSVDPYRPSRFCINGHRWESLNPSLMELLGAIE